MRNPFWQFATAGSILPRLHGVAWRDWSRDGCYTCPVPFNLLVAFAMWAWECLALRISDFLLHDAHAARRQR